jgi:hypothetical protein
VTRATAPRAKKKTTTVIEEPVELDDLGGGPSELDVSLESVEDTETLSTVLESFGETSILLKVYRETPSGQEFCFPCQTLDELFIQKNYGGGTYVVRIFIADKYRKSIKVKIAQPIGNPVTGERGDSHSVFLEKMILTMLANQGSVQQSTSVPTVTDLVQSLAALDGLRGKQESGMDMFMRGIELAKGLDGGGEMDWKQRLLGMADKALPMIAPAVQSYFGGRVPTNPNPPVAGTPPPTPEDERNMIRAMLKQGIDFLKPQFLNGLDPESAVNWVVANASNPQYQSIVRGVCNMEYAELATIDPEIGTEPLFSSFHAFYDGLRSAFIPSDNMDDDSGGTDGDPGDFGNDGNHKPNGAEKRPG